MATENGVVMTFARRTAWLMAVAALTVGAAVALSGRASTVTADSTTEPVPAAAAPAGPMAVISPDEPTTDDTRAHVDFFLEIEGIEGEMQIESWSWGATQMGASHGGGGGGGAGKVSINDFHFTKRMDKTSPMLFLACATGQHIKNAVLMARLADGTADGTRDYMVVKFKDLLISSYQTGGSSDGGAPTDEISLNFAKVEYKVGPTTVSYDLKANKGN